MIEIKQTTVLVFLGCSCMLSSCLSQHSGSSPSSLSEAEAGLVTSAVSKVRGYSPGTAVYGAWCRKACETRSLEACFPRLLHNILFTREWLKELNSSQERKDLKKTMMGQGLHLGVLGVKASLDEGFTQNGTASEPALESVAPEEWAPVDSSVLSSI